MEHLLTINDVAEMLHVSVDTVRNMKRDGRIPPPIQFSGNNHKWKSDEIQQWLSAGCPQVNLTTKGNAMNANDKIAAELKEHEKGLEQEYDALITAYYDNKSCDVKRLGELRLMLNKSVADVQRRWHWISNQRKAAALRETLLSLQLDQKVASVEWEKVSKAFRKEFNKATRTLVKDDNGHRCPASDMYPDRGRKVEAEWKDRLEAAKDKLKRADTALFQANTTIQNLTRGW